MKQKRTQDQRTVIRVWDKVGDFVKLFIFNIFLIVGSLGGMSLMGFRGYLTRLLLQSILVSLAYFIVYKRITGDSRQGMKR